MVYLYIGIYIGIYICLDKIYIQLTFGGSLRSSTTAGAYGPRACGPRTLFARATSGGPNYRSVHDLINHYPLISYFSSELMLIEQIF